MKFLDPKNDYAFKQIFGDERKKDILINFLNNILKNDKNHLITNVTLLNPFQAPHIPGGKDTILDVRCHDQSGVEYIVEMQVVHQQFFDKRVLFYTSRSYAQQLDQAEKYYELTPVIFLGILNFQFSEGSDYTSTHKICDLQTNECVIKDFQFTFVELPKFQKKESELETIADKWVYFLKYAPDLHAVPKVIHEEALKEAFDVINRLNWNQKDLEYYSRRARAAVDEKMRILSGFEKGMEKGRDKEKTEIALKMLEERLDKKIICQVTNLTSEDLDKIRESTLKKSLW